VGGGVSGRGEVPKKKGGVFFFSLVEKKKKNPAGRGGGGCLFSLGMYLLHSTYKKRSAAQDRGGE